jgi:hypothetical protein
MTILSCAVIEVKFIGMAPKDLAGRFESIVMLN